MTTPAVELLWFKMMKGLQTGEFQASFGKPQSRSYNGARSCIILGFNDVIALTEVTSGSAGEHHRDFDPMRKSVPPLRAEPRRFPKPRIHATVLLQNCELR